MKKLLVSMLAAFMIFAVAGTAAAFAPGNLTVVIYNETTNEIGIDLGDVTALDLTTPQIQVAGPGAWNAADFGGLDAADMLVGAFALDSAYNSYFATTSDVATGYSAPGFGTFINNVTNVINTFNAFPIHAATQNKSYDLSMNSGSNAPGYYGGINPVISVGEANLDAPVVDMYLYKYDTAGTLIEGATTEYQTIIRFDTAAQTITLVNSEVPVPGAIILLGSGLLGLVGIRRKND